MSNRGDCRTVPAKPGQFENIIGDKVGGKSSKLWLLGCGTSLPKISFILSSRNSLKMCCLLRSRIILPCKSDCQPIFLKKQGTYSLYAKL